MNCQEFEQNIDAYLSSLLGREIKDAMVTHRTACPACARLAKAHEIVMRSLDTAEPVPAPKGLEERILLAVEAYEAGAGRETKPVWTFGRYSTLTAALGSLAYACVLFLRLLVKHLSDLGAIPVWLNPTGNSIFNPETVLNVFEKQIVFMMSWQPSISYTNDLYRILDLAMAQVPIPYLSFTMPAYTLAALAVMVSVLWMYENDSFVEALPGRM